MHDSGSCAARHWLKLCGHLTLTPKSVMCLCFSIELCRRRAGAVFEHVVASASVMPVGTSVQHIMTLRSPCPPPQVCRHYGCAWQGARRKLPRPSSS